MSPACRSPVFDQLGDLLGCGAYPDGAVGGAPPVSGKVGEYAEVVGEPFDLWLSRPTAHAAAVEETITGAFAGPDS